MDGQKRSRADTVEEEEKQKQKEKEGCMEREGESREEGMVGCSVAWFDLQTQSRQVQ